MIRNMELYFEGFEFDEPKYTIPQAKRNDANYSRPLKADVRLVSKDTGEIKINASGTIVVKAMVEAAGNYNGSEATYTLTIKRAEQKLQFDSKRKSFNRNC